MTMTVASGFSDAPSVPPLVSAEIRRRLPELIERITSSIRQTVPDYDRALDGEYARVIHQGVEQLLGSFVDRLVDPAASMDQRDKACELLGKYEVHENRDTNDLLVAYSAARSTAMQLAAELVRDIDAPDGTLATLYELIVRYIDEATSVSLAAYKSAQTVLDAPTERHRSRLLREIFSPDPLSEDAFAKLARDSDWPLSDEGTAIALEAPQPPRVPLLAELARFPQVLADVNGAARPVLYIAGGFTASLEKELRAALPGYRFAVGFTLPLGEASQSLSWCRTLLTYHSGDPHAPDVIRCEENKILLLANADKKLYHLIIDPYIERLREVRDMEKYVFGVYEPLLNERKTIPELAKYWNVSTKSIRNWVHEVEEQIGNPAGFDSIMSVRLALRYMVKKREAARRQQAGPARALALVPDQAVGAPGPQPEPDRIELRPEHYPSAELPATSVTVTE